MRRTRATFLLAFFILVSGLSAQDGEVYFSLTSNKTWGAGEKPVISMYANNVDMLEFRVYRVKDPLAFFIRLKDPHDFGGQVPPPPRQGSLIESFHRWKGARLADIRNFFRVQFSPGSRHAIRIWRPTMPGSRKAPMLLGSTARRFSPSKTATTGSGARRSATGRYPIGQLLSS